MPKLMVLITWFLDIVVMVLIARVIISLIPRFRESSIHQFLLSVTEPFVNPVRIKLEKTPFGQGMFDLSVLVVIVLIYIIQFIISFWI